MKRTSTHLALLFIFASLYTTAQNLNFNWVQLYNPGKSSVVATDEAGNLYSTGQFADSLILKIGNDSIRFYTDFNYPHGYLMKRNPSGDLLWVKEFIGTGHPTFNDIVIKHGYVYMTGYYLRGVDFDPSDSAHILTVVDNGGPININAFVLKMDTNGNFKWVGELGGLLSELAMAHTIAVNSSGDMYIGGKFEGGGDFDPGPGQQYMSVAETNQEDVFIVKLDSSGNYKWSTMLTSDDNGEGIAKMVVDKQDNVYGTGNFTKRIGDFDMIYGEPSVKLVNNNSTFGSNDIYLFKLNNRDSLQWVKNIGAVDHDNVSAMEIDAHDNLYLSGSFGNTVDFSLGAGTARRTAMGYNDGFILKLDANAKYQWVQTFGTTGNENAMAGNFAIGDSSIYVVGRLSKNGVSMNGGSIVLTAKEAGPGQYIVRMDTTGLISGTWQMEGITDEVDYYTQYSSNSVAVGKHGNLYLSGLYSDTVDFNPGVGKYMIPYPVVGNGSGYLLSLNENDCPDIAIVVDSISNITCANFTGYAAVHATNGIEPYTYMWNSDATLTTPELVAGTSGLYVIRATDNNQCAIDATVLVSGPAEPAGFDMNANLVSYSNFRAGFPVSLLVDAFNNRCTPVAGQLMLVFPAGMTYNDASPAPAAVRGDTLVWNTGMLNLDSAHFKPVVNFTVAADLRGNTICLATIVTPLSGDMDSSNNKKEYCFRVTGSYDPNLISVRPGVCDPGYILPNQELEYTIVFQNTGNDSAINVYVLDTIAAELDITLIQVKGNSHAMLTEVLPGNVLKFMFKNIYLVDSLANEPASHGYVTYTIEQNTVANGTVIENKADIYFDFNDPVTTNMVSNTVLNVLPACITSTGSAEEMSFGLYPNPASTAVTIASSTAIREIKLLDISGRTMFYAKPTQGANHTILPVTGLTNGIYLVQLTTANGMGTQKLIIQH